MAPDVDAPTLAGAESEKLKSREWVGMIKAGEFFQASEVRTKDGQRLAGLVHFLSAIDCELYKAPHCIVF